MNKLKVGIIGTGRRGLGWINFLMQREDMDILYVSDLYPDKLETAEKTLKDGGIDVKATCDYHDILNDEKVEAVLVFTGWEDHVPVSIESMKAGKAVGMEVGGAYSIQECYELIETQKKTGAFFMMLENCCYGRREMMCLNMANLGIFGDIVHCDGGYKHDLRNQVCDGRALRHYRMRNYLNRNLDNYPTHAFLPICKILGINDGNRIVSLFSMASKAKGLKEYSKQMNIGCDDILTRDVAQGDVVTTLMKCAGGETITLTLDTTLPRFYSRNFQVHGTKGLYTEDNDSIWLDDFTVAKIPEKYGKDICGSAADFEEKYDHPLWKKTLESGVQGGHGGMDGLVMDAFVASVKNGWESPIDVYDAATAMAVSVLSGDSIASGMPVSFPDFTNGKWLIREHGEENDYTLRRKSSN